MLEALKVILIAPLAIAWWIMGPATYIIVVVDTWQARASVLWKMFMSLTLDALIAAFWPAAWVVWIIQEFSGVETPITRVLGF